MSTTAPAPIRVGQRVQSPDPPNQPTHGTVLRVEHVQPPNLPAREDVVYVLWSIGGLE